MDNPEQLTPTEARAGAVSHGVRYVLVISLVLIVAAFAALLMIWG